MKFALLYPFYPAPAKQTQGIIPLGICQIKSKLCQMGYDSKVFDLNFIDHRLKKWFLSNMPALKWYILKGGCEIDGYLLKLMNENHLLDFDALCFSIFSFEQLIISLALSKFAKTKNKIVVLGGSYCDQNSELMKDFKFVDFMIRGTGEVGIESMIRVIDGRTDGNVKNIVYRQSDKSLITAPLENSVRDMSLPDFSDLPLDRYKDQVGCLAIPYCIGIGCSNRCHYCSSHKNMPPLHKDPKQIGCDIRLLKDQYGARYFFLMCNLFNISETYMQDVARELAPLGITWGTSVTYKNISIETLRLMKESGCRKFSIGLETGSQRLLEAMNKKINVKSVRLLEEVKHVGINNRINIILGLPGETREDVLKTVDFLKQHQSVIDEVYFMLFQLHKGAYIFDHPEQFGLRLVQCENGVFEKYVFNHAYRYLLDDQPKVLSMEKYPHYDLVKSFIKKYRVKEERVAGVLRKRILFYYHHFGGCGHGMRILSLCKALQSVGKFKILVINSGIPQPELGIERYAKVYNLPSLRAADNLFTGLAANVGQDLRAVLKKRCALLQKIAEKFLPDLAVIEHFPFGRLRLTEEILDFIHQLKERRCSIYSSTRDLILQKGKREYFNLFNGIFIHEDPHYESWGEAPCNSMYTGRVHPYAEFVSGQKKVAGAAPGPISKKFVVVSIGGGLDGHELLDKLIQIKPKVDEQYPCRFMIFTGKTYPEERYAKLQKKLPKDCQIVQWDSHLMEYICTADLFISMGGYNSINSHLLTKAASMVFPRLSDEEQRLRVQRYGLPYYDYQAISREDLLNEICLKLATGPQEKKRTSMAGAQVTARIIMQAMDLKNAKIRLMTQCNLDCAMCSWKNTDERLDEQRVYTLLDELWMLSVRGVNFTGGEPTLYPGLERVMRYAKAKGFHVSLSTNGFNLDALKRVVVFLNSVDISIDSPDAQLNDKIRGRRGAYAAALQSIRYLCANGIKPHINVTVRPDNYKGIHQIIGIISRDIASISFTLVDTSMNKLKELEFTHDELEDYYGDEVVRIFEAAEKYTLPVRITPFLDCFAGQETRNIFEEICFNKKGYMSRLHEIFSLTQQKCRRTNGQIRINANGDVRPCCYLDDVQIPLGNINNEPLWKIVINDHWFKGIVQVQPGRGVCASCYQGYGKYRK